MTDKPEQSVEPTEEQRTISGGVLLSMERRGLITIVRHGKATRQFARLLARRERKVAEEAVESYKRDESERLRAEADEILSNTREGRAFGRTADRLAERFRKVAEGAAYKAARRAYNMGRSKGIPIMTAEALAAEIANEVCGLPEKGERDG